MFVDAIIVRFLEPVALELTVAPLAKLTNPLFQPETVLDALRVTFRSASSLLSLVTEIDELVDVANQTPVVPIKPPVVSVEPEITSSRSA